MKDEEYGEAERSLDTLYNNLKIVRKETLKQLGDEDALHIIDFHANNWIDIIKLISSKYNREEQMNIVLFQFARLYKEIYWLQLFFQYGNYQTIFRNLRYILELICQAYFIDNTHPCLSLDGQIEKIQKIEKKFFGWNLIKTILQEILDKNEQHINSRFYPLWDYLNKNVHPSLEMMDKIATEDFQSLVTDSFNKNLAKDALKVINEIFDIINMIIIKRFPMIKELIVKYEFLNEWEELFPNTIEIIKK